MTTAIDTQSLPRSDKAHGAIASARSPAKSDNSQVIAGYSAGLFAALGLQLVTGVAVATEVIGVPWFLAIEAAIFGLTIWLLIRLNRFTRLRLISPLNEVRLWALRMRGGNLNARLPVPEGIDCGDLTYDINNLADEFQRLARDLDREVTRHTERLALKTRSLQILYDVAASVNMARDLEELLTRFLYTLVDLVDARAGVVRLLNDSRQMRLIAAVGLESEVLEKEALVPIGQCLCGQAADTNQLLIDGESRSCKGYLGRSALDGNVSTLIAVPLQYRGTTLGVYNLFLEPGIEPSDDLRELLISIGRHLGMAIEKAQVDKKAQFLSIMQERTMLAHELHDSVAQTIASLRYRVRAMDELMPADSSAKLRNELQQIRNTLDEAHTELRELMVHYRAPMDERGLLPAIEDLIERFRRETGITIFVQKDCGGSNLPALLEMQVLRIIQEALANVRKHSKAQTVRILMRCTDGEHYRVLIEDDGVGFAKTPDNGRLGEHVGLGIMQERAQRLGGTIAIESEPHEGTRVELTFRHRRDPSQNPENKSEISYACLDH